MTRLHRLTVAAGPEGLSVGLECPYKAAELPGLPEFMVPDCRPGRDAECAARTALAERGIAGCWGGPTVQLCEVTYVNVWRDDGGLHLAAVTENAPPKEDVAAWLVEAAGEIAVARGTAILLDPTCGVTNVNACHKWAVARGVVSAELLARWRSQLLAWHEGNHLATPTRPAGTPQPL